MEERILKEMKIIAHRGASSYKTENSKAAFEAAVDMNVDGIELDIRLSKDGTPIIHHDPTINRLSNGKGFVHHFTLEELREFTFKKKTFPLHKREKIVTLEEFFIFMKDFPDIELHIEIKNNPIIDDDLEEKALQLSSDYHMEERIIYSSFDHQSLKRLYDLEPTVKIGLLIETNLVGLFKYTEQTGMPIYSIHPKHHIVTKQMVQEAHRHNILVNPYTVNSKRTARKLKKMGVDGIITNNPNILN